ncbi:DNA primase [Gammaproteobacteria bacterium]
MAFGHIPQTFIDELINRVDLVEVIDSRVPLKKVGRNYMACCPFHNEKTPSFNVNSEKQFYYCFGCGVHGTAISFLMDYEHLEFPDAVEELARGLGIVVPREGNTDKPSSEQQRDLHDWLEEVANYYQRTLAEHPQATSARLYLARRGLNNEVITRFRIGYALPGWDNLLRALGGETAREPLLAAGMLAQKEDTGRVYDRFRNRVMFPIVDRRGRILGFGGRTLGDDTPKYLNSPETSLFRKGQELYGLRQAIEQVRSPERLLVVEGYLDVVALAQHGIPQVVATLGTATTATHLERLFCVTSRLVFCFDGDQAGRNAAWRALGIALPELHDQRDIRFLLLPEGEDPDTLVRAEGHDAFTARIHQAKPVMEYLLETIRSQVDTERTDRQARVVELARPLMAKLSPGIYQTLLIQELAELARIAPDKLSKFMRSGVAPPPTAAHVRINEQQVTRPSPVRTALGLLLAHPDLAMLVSNPAKYAVLDVRGASLFAEVVVLLQQHRGLKLASILEHWRGTETERHLARLAQWIPLMPEEGMAAELADALERLEQQALEQETTRLVDKARVSGLTDTEKSRLPTLLARKHALTLSRVGSGDIRL